MTQSAVSIEHTKDTTDLFVLKHKDLDVAMMKMDVRTGMIEYVLAVYLPEELPVLRTVQVLANGGNCALSLIRGRASVRC